MKNHWIWGALALVAVAPAFAADPAPAAAPAPAGAPQSEIEKVSYILGSQFGHSLRSQYVDVDMNALIKGITDATQGKALAMKPDEMRKVLDEFQPKLMKVQQEKRQAEGAKSKAAGDAFLAENGKKPGVKTTASGLQYIVAKEGKGALPKATDTVKVNYRGTLVDGTQFDSSYDRGEPAEIPANRVIPGWQEALQLMKVGSQWKLFVPSGLAYGEQGAGGDIPPNAALIFDIELLDIVKQPETLNLPPEPAPGAPGKPAQK